MASLPSWPENGVLGSLFLPYFERAFPELLGAFSMPDDKVTEDPKITPKVPADVPAPAKTPTPSNDGGYDDASIRVLDDVEHVRTRPGMYIGGYNTRGLH